MDHLSDRSSLQDIVEYCGSDCKLTKNGLVSYRGKNYLPTVSLQRLEATKSKLFGVASGVLHELSFEGSRIIARDVSVGLTSLVHTSATRDGSYIWIQNNKEGWLCSENLEVVEKASISGYNRNYGQTRGDYIDSHNEGNFIEASFQGEKSKKRAGYSVYGQSGNCIVSAKKEPYRDIRVLKSGVYRFVK